VIRGARCLPTQHLTIRVPWHDSGWSGTFCKTWTANICCTVLPRIATGRDDAFETLHAGESIEDLDRSQHRPCVDEHRTFMAKFPLSMQKKHPYTEIAKTTHGHFTVPPTRFDRTLPQAFRFGGCCASRWRATRSGALAA
jgi:hypothetical protein